MVAGGIPAHSAVWQWVAMALTGVVISLLGFGLLDTRSQVIDRMAIIERQIDAKESEAKERMRSLSDRITVNQGAIQRHAETLAAMEAGQREVLRRLDSIDSALSDLRKSLEAWRTPVPAPSLPPSPSTQ